MQNNDEKKKTDMEDARESKENKPKLTKKARLAVFIIGIVLSAAAVVLIVYAIQSMAASDKQASDSLSDIKDVISEQTPAATENIQQQDEDYQGPLETADPAPTLETSFSAETQPEGEAFGYMIFDTIIDDGKAREVALIEGTSPEDLDKGAGHYVGFAYPGENGNSPVFGHRTTVFKDFDRLQVNDTIRIVTNYGTYVYQIVDMQVTVPMDPLMFKVYDEPMLTIITCYPFIYSGHAPDRYVVICKLISSSGDTIEY